MERREIEALFDKWCKKLRLNPDWDIRLQLVDDPSWKKTGDFQVDCDDKKAILLLNWTHPKQENLEEVIIHELMPVSYTHLWCKNHREPDRAHTAAPYR